MGELLPRRKYPYWEPAGRAPRNRDVCRDRGGSGFSCLHPPAAGESEGGGAVLFWNTLSRPASARRFFDARRDQCVQRAAWFALPARPADARRNRRDDADRALHYASREEG